LINSEAPLSKRKSSAADGALIFGPRESDRWGAISAAIVARRRQSTLSPFDVASNKLMNSASWRPALSKIVSMIDVSFQAVIRTLARTKIALFCRPGTARKRMASKTGRCHLLSLAWRLPERTAKAARPLQESSSRLQSTWVHNHEKAAVRLCEQPQTRSPQRAGSRAPQISGHPDAVVSLGQ
jgi:hypothetical protein